MSKPGPHSADNFLLPRKYWGRPRVHALTETLVSMAIRTASEQQTTSLCDFRAARPRVLNISMLKWLAMEPSNVNESDPVRDAILKALRGRSDVTLPELVNMLQAYSEAEIKRAVWPLVSDQAVELTPQRNLRMARAAGH